MRSNDKVNITVTPEEMARINGHAEARGLPNTAFVRLVVAGAMARGGGTLDRILVEGESALDGKIRHVSRQGGDGFRAWTTVGQMRSQLKENPAWELRSDRIASTKYDSGVESWWYLTHADHPGWKMPLAFRKVEAIRLATDKIRDGLIPGKEDSR